LHPVSIGAYHYKVIVLEAYDDESL
jgi:hypothetical protein